MCFCQFSSIKYDHQALLSEPSFSIGLYMITQHMPKKLPPCFVQALWWVRRASRRSRGKLQMLSGTPLSGYWYLITRQEVCHHSFPRILKTMVWCDTEHLTKARPLGNLPRQSPILKLPLCSSIKAWDTQVYYGQDSGNWHLPRYPSRKIICAIITIDIPYLVPCLRARTTLLNTTRPHPSDKTKVD